MMTSLMFLILFGIVQCEEISNICVKTGSTDCPSGYTVVSAAADIDKSITTIPVNIITDAALTIDVTKFKLVRMISKLGTVAAPEMTVAITEDGSHTSLSLNEVVLSITNSADKKITFDSLLLDDGATVKTGSKISIKTLKCTSATSAKSAVEFSTELLVIEGNDVIGTITADTKNAKIKDYSSTAVEVSILENKPKKVSVISTVTKENDFTIEADFTQLAPKIEVTLIYGNVASSAVTLKGDSAVKKSENLIINVETYYKEASDLSEDAKACYKRNAAVFLVDSNGRKVPQASKYCLFKDNTRTNLCPEDAQILWNGGELKGVNNGEEIISVYVSGQDTNNVEINLEDIKDKSIKFLGIEKEQKILMNAAKKDDTITKEFRFNNISVTKKVPKDSTDASLGFKRLILEKSKIALEVASSMKLSSTPAIKVSSEDLISDASSFDDFKNEKPINSFSVINAKKASFKGDGSKATIDGVEFDVNKIPVPFTFLSSNQDKAEEIELSIEKDGESSGKALPFTLNLTKGAKMNVKFGGDWSKNKIILNVEEGSKFEGIKSNAGDVSPSLEKQGSGEASMDGKVVVNPTNPPSDESGLSGGAIAGIVIAVIVVVAAIVVGVVFFVKKKKIGN